MHRRVWLVMGLLLAVTLVAGCTSDKSADSASGSNSPTPSPTPGATPNLKLGRRLMLSAKVVKFEDPLMLTVTTYGSSSCPMRIASVEATASNRLDVSFRPPGQELCTADLAPHHETVPLPEGVDLSEEVFAVFDWRGKGYPAVIVSPPSPTPIP